MSSDGEIGIGKTVCVTGASGYIASWLIKLLLQRNYTVKASVRHLNDPGKTKHLIELPGAKDRLHLYEAQLMEEGSFDAVIDGCDGVFHVASPCFWDTQDPQADLIEPAVNGTLNVLRSCSKTPSVKRVIFTSSIATALHNGKPRTPDVVVDETWFSDPEFCKKFKLWYHLSKTLAEDSAMNFAKEHGIDLIIINPAACLGPLLQPRVNSSAQFILNLLTGAQTYKNVTLGWVDVRDVGNAHILAFEAPSSEGRYFVLERTAHYSEVVKILRELYPDIQLPGKTMSVEAAATLVAPTVEKTAACISDFSARHVRYLTHFEENYESLMRKMSELRCHRDHVKRRVEVDEASLQMRRTPIVAQWFERVRSFEVEVDAVLQECSREIETGQRFCVNYCPKNWWLRYKIGKKVSKKLEVVVEVISNGQFEVVADQVLPSLVEVKYESQSVGMHEAFSQVSSWLVDDAVKIIGIYGMGGVGKTTLLKKINNVFKEKVDMLNVVIWVVVSSHPSLENVQRQIGRRLGLPWSEDEDQNDKAQLIFNALTKKKFLLLLDDVWKPLNFEEIGIPCQNPHSKVVFTTRSESVCGEMEADKKFKVPILERQQAWELFQHKVGQEVLNCHPEIPKLAKTVARECGGLPLALITIGRAMSSKKTTHEWNHALKTLKKNASEFKGMEEKVLSILKFSYDNLEDNTARYCFLYFSLYPEDWEIPIDHIIRRWIGEGFLDKFKDMDDALNKGHDIIGSLKAACLLETSTWGDSCVKMHDSVRDLALWITSDCGKKENKHLVQAGVGLSQAHEIEGWKNAERISLMENNLKELTGTPKCHRLVTLMLQRNLNLSVISDDFFCNMPILNVLDLSYTGIKVVPKSVGGLLQLQFLNLVSTDIDSLPEELGNLVKLKYLNLGVTRVSTIPRGMVSCFSKMQMLYFGETKLDDSLAAELECLEQLRELGITIRKIPTPISQQLTSCITTLEIKDCVGLTELSLLSSPLFRKTRRLREFEIRDCLELETFNINCLEEDEDEMGPLFTLTELQICGLPKLNNIIWAETTTHLQFSHLQAVLIRSCPTLKDISWLVSAPMLRYLKIGDCLELEEIILGRFTMAIDRNQDLFSRLEYFDLEGLLKLKSIVRFAPLFPCLHGIFVSDCPLLKKLPLASASTDKSKLVIRGKADWWNELQWENEIVKSTFQPFFRPRRVK